MDKQKVPGLNKKQELGQYGERVAAAFLMGKGYRIIKRNYRCRAGEIDIIALKGEFLVFCEVKTRSGSSCGRPAAAVTEEKLLHINKAAKHFMAYGNWCRYQPRVDVIEIIMEVQPTINHIISVTE